MKIFNHNIFKKLSFKKLIPFTIILTLVCLFFPGFLLNKLSKRDTDIVHTAPYEYYYGDSSSIAINASSKLTSYQKTMLISGAWDSHESLAPLTESDFTEYEAATTAKEKIEILYKRGLYPCSLITSYNKWYTWKATLNKAVDTTFNTYISYYWVITFNKYDGTETHTILMTDSGNILLATAILPEDYHYKTYSISKNPLTLFQAGLPEEKDILSIGYSIIKTDISKINSTNKLEYPGFSIFPSDINELCIIAIGRKDLETEDDIHQIYSDNTSEEVELFYAYQVKTKGKYTISLIPYSD